MHNLLSLAPVIGNQAISCSRQPVESHTQYLRFCTAHCFGVLWQCVSFWLLRSGVRVGSDPFLENRGIYSWPRIQQRRIDYGNEMGSKRMTHDYGSSNCPGLVPGYTMDPLGDMVGFLCSCARYPGPTFHL